MVVAEHAQNAPEDSVKLAASFAWGLPRQIALPPCCTQPHATQSASGSPGRCHGSRSQSAARM